MLCYFDSRWRKARSSKSGNADFAARPRSMLPAVRMAKLLIRPSWSSLGVCWPWVESIPTRAPEWVMSGVDCTALKPARPAMSRKGRNQRSIVTSSRMTGCRLNNARPQAHPSLIVTLRNSSEKPC